MKVGRRNVIGASYGSRRIKEIRLGTELVWPIVPVVVTPRISHSWNGLTRLFVVTEGTGNVVSSYAWDDTTGSLEVLE